MTTEFNPSQHIQLLALEAFTDLLSSAQEGVLTGGIHLSVVRDLFALQQSFLSTPAQLRGQARPLNQGNHSRAQLLQGQQNAPKVNGSVLIQGPIKALEARLDQLLTNYAQLERGVVSGKGQTSLPKHNSQKAEKPLPNAGEKTSVVQGNREKVLEHLGKQFRVAETPELKPYLAILLQMGHLLTQSQDLAQVFGKQLMSKLLSPEIQKTFSEVKELIKELKEVMQLASKNASLLPKLEARMQELTQALKELSRQVSLLLNPNQSQEKNAPQQNQFVLQNNPALKELLSSLAVKGTALSMGSASHVQQVATAKLPSFVVAPFQPDHRVEHRKLGSTLSKPGPEPIWEDQHEEESKREDLCEEEEEPEEES